jgi:hypothetical protein
MRHGVDHVDYSQFSGWYDAEPGSTEPTPTCWTPSATQTLHG